MRITEIMKSHLRAGTGFQYSESKKKALPKTEVVLQNNAWTLVNENPTLEGNWEMLYSRNSFIKDGLPKRRIREKYNLRPREEKTCLRNWALKSCRTIDFLLKHHMFFLYN